MKLIVATGNKGKLKEIQKILGSLGYETVTMKDAGVDVEIEENGKTFLENALIKARTVHDITGENVIADDSGLCVDALLGAPGVYSARYAGEGASDSDRINKLLGEMKGCENRAAHFKTAIAFIDKDGVEITAEGRTDGEILTEPDGENGFGYDPVFFSYDLKKSFGRADSDEKNKISHRGRALMALYEKLKEKK